MTNVRPWWQELKLRDELLETSGTVGDIQMSLHQVAYPIPAEPVPYADVAYFGDITHPTPSLVRVAADIAIRLGGEQGQSSAAKGVWRFDQGMGGGKSHALVALWHLATRPKAFAATEVGRHITEEADRRIGTGTMTKDLGKPIVVALPGDQMDPDRIDTEVFGAAQSLRERFLFRLYEGDHDRWVAAKDTLGYEEALRSVNRPVLVLFDEVMHYLRRSTAHGDTPAAVDDQSFLIDMMRHTGNVPHCAAVLVMIDSSKDPIALSGFGSKCRDELEDESHRGLVKTDAVTEPTDFADIIRRRLFVKPAKSSIVEATANKYLKAMTDPKWQTEVFAKLSWSQPDDFRKQVLRGYPFHPALIDLAEQEWAQVAGFQRVRSTIRMFASTVYAHLHRLASDAGVTVAEAQADPSLIDEGSGAALIGPGDLVLSNPDVRESLLDSGLIVDAAAVANYRQVISTDIVGEDDTQGNARQLDLFASDNNARKVNPRAAERAATAALVYSINDRPQGTRGGSEPEVLAAAFVPDITFGYGDAEVALQTLKDSQVGLASLEIIQGRGGQPPRLYLSTRKTYGMFFRDAKNAVADSDCYQELRRRAANLATAGPFDRVVFVDQPKPGSSPRDSILAAGLDQPRATRLVVLDPHVFTLLNGDDSDTRAAIKAAMGLGDHHLPVTWPASAVFAVVNTYRRRHAMTITREYLAASRVLEREAVRSDPDLARHAESEVAEKQRELDKQVKRAYQHIVWLAPDGVDRRTWADHRIDSDLETALNGQHVWRILQQEGRALGTQELTGKALLHNLRDADYGKPLKELRDDFWKTPRLPLLPEGELDLRRAIWDAISSGRVRIVDATGASREAKSANDINLNSDVQRLQLVEDASAPEGEDKGDGTKTKVVVTPVAAHELQVSMNGTHTVDKSNSDELWKALRAVADSIDDGKVTWLQLSIKATMTVDAADDVEAAAKNAGMNTSVREI